MFVTYDKRETKDAARGRWKEILINRIGVDEKYLTGKPYPTCPICLQGTTDKWRWTNYQDNGGAICNSCLKAGDGFEFIMAYSRVTFDQAVNMVGEYLGIDPVKPKAKPKPKQTDKAFRSKGWNENLARAWANAKGIPLSRLEAFGCLLAEHYSHSVLALPQRGPDGEDTGYTMYHSRPGGKLLVGPKDNRQEVRVKVLKLDL